MYSEQAIRFRELIPALFYNWRQTRICVDEVDIPELKAIGIDSD